MKKIIYILSSLFCLSLSQSMAQDTLVVMKDGQAVYKRVVSEVDSIIFKPKKLTVTDIDGNIYPAVTIGTQVWMGENLRVEKYNDGTPIPLVIDNAIWAANFAKRTKLPMMAWYANDKATHTANKNGALYNWYVVDTKKLCPTGWHVPTNAEWANLVTYLGDIAGAGVKLKSTVGWNVTNITGLNGTNETKFTAIPSGIRYDINSSDAFSNLGSSAYWWSASENDTYTHLAWRLFTHDYSNSVYRHYTSKVEGMSVRCLKD